MNNRLNIDAKIIVFSFIYILYLFFASYLAKINIISIIFPTIIFVLFFMKNLNNFKTKNSCILYLLIMILDAILIIYNCVYRNLPFTNVDWSNFDLFAKSALYSSNSLIDIFNNSIDFFTAIIAILYRIFGSDIKFIYFYILPCAQILSFYVYKCIYLISDDMKMARIGSLLILLYPVNFIFSLSVLREIPIQTLIVLSIYCMINYFKSNKFKHYLYAIIFIIFACLMHSAIIGVFIAYIYIFIQKKFSGRIKYFNVKAIVLSLFILIIVGYTPIGTKMTARFNNLSSIEDIVEVINSQNIILEANTQYITSNSKNLTDILITLPYRYIMFIMAPFIWQVYSFDTILAFFIDAIPRLIIIFYILQIFKNRKEMNENKKKFLTILLMSIIFTGLIFSFGCNNYGQAMRHRSKLLPLEIIIICSFKKMLEMRKKV